MQTRGGQPATPEPHAALTFILTALEFNEVFAYESKEWGDVHVCPSA